MADNLKAEKARLRERIRDIQSLIEGFDGKSDASSMKELKRQRQLLEGVKAELASLG